MDDYLTVRQAARELHVSTAALYKAIRLGRLPAVMLMERHAVSRADLEVYKTRTSALGPQGGRPRTRPEESGPKRPVGRPRKQQEGQA